MSIINLLSIIIQIALVTIQKQHNVRYTFITSKFEMDKIAFIILGVVIVIIDICVIIYLSKKATRINFTT